MPIVFASNTGKVAAMSDKAAEGSFSLGNTQPKISYTSHKAIITQVGISAAGNYQFLHTIGNDVYVYVFGDRMGSVTLSGVSFQGDCQGGGGGTAGLQNTTTFPAASGKHGFELLYDWYKDNRIASRLAPIDITIGKSTTFKGFVIALQGNIKDPVYRTVDFQISIATLPEK